MPIRTACTYDCPDACGLEIDADGRGPRVSGDPTHPITRGFVCQRIRSHAARLSAPERLRAPLLRRGGGWEEIGWDDALDLAAEKLQLALAGYGPPSVLHVHGGGSLGLSKELVRHFFRSLGPVTEVGGGLCGEAGEEAQRLDFGDCATHDYTDLVHSRAVVLWGRNPLVTGLHLVPFLQEARARGVPVALVEVLPTASAKLADRAVTIAPGADGLLALAILRRLYDAGRLDPGAMERTENFAGFEPLLLSDHWEGFARRCGARPEEVEYLAGLFADHRPTATLVGWGLQRRASGGRNLRLIDALGLLTGNVGRPGAGVNFTSWRRRGLDAAHLAQATGRELRAPHFGQDLAALRDPPVRFVYVCAANPVTQHPDSRASAAALRGAGFVVVADAFLTDTAAQADLVLPPALMLEEDDAVGSYAHHHVARAPRAVEPPAGARTDLWIVHELRRRLGLPPDPVLEDPRAALERLTAPWFAAGSPARNPAQPTVPFAERFATPSGKARLVTELPDPVAASDGYPLVFMTHSHPSWQASQLPEDRQRGAPECFVSPRAPGAESLGEGELARLVSPLGALEVRVRLDPRMRPELCLVHRGGWLRFGRGVNALVEARSTDLGGGAAFYDQRVRLEKIGP